MFAAPYELPGGNRPFTDAAQLVSLYVIEIAEDRIKVGVSVDPVRRVATHRGTALAHGCTPGREWISPRGTGTAEREAALIAFCAEQPASEKFRSEYFAGVPFLVAVRHAAELCGDTRTLSHLVEVERAVRWSEFELSIRSTAELPRAMCSAEEAAAWLRVPVSRIQRLIATGELPVKSLGTSQRIPVAALRKIHGARFVPHRKVTVR